MKCYPTTDLSHSRREGRTVSSKSVVESCAKHLLSTLLLCLPIIFFSLPGCDRH